jgi:hypothetical protein
MDGWDNARVALFLPHYHLPYYPSLEIRVTLGESLQVLSASMVNTAYTVISKNPRLLQTTSKGHTSCNGYSSSKHKRKCIRLQIEKNSGNWRISIILVLAMANGIRVVPNTATPCPLAIMSARTAFRKTRVDWLTEFGG